MERIGDGEYRCTACGSALQVGADANPVAMLVAQSGKPNDRVVTVGEVEVHRCRFPADGRTSVPVDRVAASTNGSSKPSAQVAQAAGMVAVQADCRIEQGFVLMSHRALDLNCTLDEIAVAVIERLIRFDMSGAEADRMIELRRRIGRGAKVRRNSGDSDVHRRARLTLLSSAQHALSEHALM